jgi:hypothetical protein
MDDRNVKFRWESDCEFNYRNTVRFISNNVSKLLRSMQEVSKRNNDYKPIRNELQKFFEILKNSKTLQVPLTYNITHNFLIQGYEYYIKGLDILIDSIENEKAKSSNKNISNLNKAATFIEVGNSFTRIVSCKNFEMFEKQQEKYNIRDNIN